jgi:hypothetical protein
VLTLVLVVRLAVEVKGTGTTRRVLVSTVYEVEKNAAGGVLPKSHVVVPLVTVK